MPFFPFFLWSSPVPSISSLSGEMNLLWRKWPRLAASTLVRREAGPVCFGRVWLVESGLHLDLGNIFLDLRQCSEPALLKVFQFLKPSFQFLSSLAGYYIFSYHCPVMMSGEVRWAVRNSLTAAGTLLMPGNGFQIVSICAHFQGLKQFFPQKQRPLSWRSGYI